MTQAGAAQHQTTFVTTHAWRYPLNLSLTQTADTVVTSVVGSTKQQVYCDKMHAVFGDFNLGDLARVIQLGQRR
jgi:hypothetical protein